jgi:TolB-like protein
MNARSLIVVVLLILPSVARGQERIGLLPFENVSGVREATSRIMPIVEEALRKKGYSLPPGAQIETHLEEERIRFLDSLPIPAIKKISQKFALDAVLTGTILCYKGKAGSTPQVAISARLLSREGALLWGKTVSMTGEDTRGVFSLGAIDNVLDLIPVATRRLLETFRTTGGVEQRSAWSQPALFLFLSSGPTVYRSPKFDPGREPRICILPLMNESANRNAGRVLQSLLSVRLSGKDRFDVVEPGDLLEAMVAEKIRYSREIEPVQRKILSRRLRTRYFLEGRIYKYEEGIAQDRTVGFPKVELYLSVVDGETGELVWIAQHSREGGEYETFLQSGILRNPAALADQILEEMAKTMERR